ncbi:MAG: serine hydrolase domain-containing protein [Chloroflexota bacterium]
MSAKRLLRQSLAIGAALALGLRLFGARRSLAKPISGGASPDGSLAEVDAYVERQMARLSIPGATLAIVEGDQIVHLRGFGQARPGGEAPSPQTPFFIGSTTKSFTAVAVMQLVEAGKVDLDAPVQRYLPWFRVADPQASAQMTVRHLLNQTSGLPLLPGWKLLADFDDRPDATERQARALATLALTRPVGSAWEYSNLNYNLLGLIVEAASGKSYADYVRDHIFVPLEMSHSYSSHALAKRNGLAVGHQYWFTRPVAVPDIPVAHGSLPSGQLISCAEDMAHYLIAHLNGGRYGDQQILSAAGIAELHRGVAEAGEMGVDMGEYAMGWYTQDIGQTKASWHTGIVPGFFTFMAVLPEQKRGLGILCNGFHFMMTPTLTEAGVAATTLLAGERPVPSRFGFVPLTPLGLLLVPVLQVVGVVATLRRLCRWHHDPSSRPSRGRVWGRHILLPLVPNLSLAAVPVFLQASGLLQFLLLFMPDVSWLALLCGGFAGIWGVLRTGLMLRALAGPTAIDRAPSGRA